MCILRLWPAKYNEAEVTFRIHLNRQGNQPIISMPANRGAARRCHVGMGLVVKHLGVSGELGREP